MLKRFFLLSLNILLCSAVFSNSVMGVPNPAAVYCRDLGYVWERVETLEGDIGVCWFPDGSSCSDWDFFTGSCGLEHSYCVREGYGIATGHDCGGLSECCLCILPDGSKVKVLDLMVSEGKSDGLQTGRSAVEKSAVEKYALRDISKVGVGEGDRLGAVTYFDWRDENSTNWMSPVKNQGFCGSCWAFSAVGAVEAKYNIVFNNSDLDPNLAEQYLVSTCCGAGDCGGGWHEAALEFIKEVGVSDEDCFPYLQSNSDCSNRCADAERRLWSIDDFGYATTNRETIKQYLMDKGPLSVALDITDWEIFGTDCGGYADLDHAVVLVGFNDTGQYWIAKNSWGVVFEDNGYFRVDYGSCGIESEVFYVELDSGIGDYTASNETVLVGQIGEGNLSDTYSIDGVGMRLDEECNATAGTCMGLNVSFTFELDDSDSSFLFARHNSTVNSTEAEFELYLYNFLDGVWEFMAFVPGASSLNLYSICSGDCSEYMSGSNTAEIAYYAPNCSSCDMDSVRIDWLSIHQRNYSTWSGFVPGTKILLVDDDGGASYESYYMDAVNDSGFGYSYWNVSTDGSILPYVFTGYSMVIWFTGNKSLNTLTSVDMINLGDYLDGGKTLFISGQDIGWDINGASFYEDYLHALYVRDDTNINSLNGVPGDPIGDGLAIDISGGDGADNQLWPSEISPADSNTSCILNYYGDGCGAIRADNGVYRIVYFAFGFESIDNAGDRETVISRIIEWLDITPPGVFFSPPTPDNGSMVDSDTVLFNVSFTEESPDTLVFYLNGIPEYHAYSGSYMEIEKTLANGLYNYSVWVNDSAGNVNYTQTRYLIVNATPPSVTLISPENNSLSNGTVNFTCNATDNVRLESISLYWNYSGGWQLNGTLNVSGNISSAGFLKTGLSDSAIAWNCRACDNSSNCAFSSTNLSVVVDTSPPVIVSYSAAPKVASNGSNISLSLNATDPYLNTSWAVVDLPDLSQATVNLPGTYTVNMSGRHNVSFHANDSLGHVAVVEDYFIAAEAMVFNSSFFGYNDSIFNVTLKAFFDDSLIAVNESEGNISLNIADYVYDLYFSVFNRSLNVRLLSINLSENNNRMLGFDMLTSVPGYLISYAVNNSYQVTNASLNLSYAGSGYGNKEYLGMYLCANWNFSARNCSGIWVELDATNVLAGEYFLLNVSGFSGFSVKQESYCGDGVKDAGEGCDGSDLGGKTCVSMGYDYGSLSCSQSCVISTSGCRYSGGGSSGGGGIGGYSLKVKISCFDSIKNCHDGDCEEGVDCGGPCRQCPSCFDGIQNQGETGVDCGGPCKPCSTTTSTTYTRSSTTSTRASSTLVGAPSTTSSFPDDIIQVTTSSIPQKTSRSYAGLLTAIFVVAILAFALSMRYSLHVRRAESKESSDLKNEITGKADDLRMLSKELRMLSEELHESSDD